MDVSPVSDVFLEPSVEPELPSLWNVGFAGEYTVLLGRKYYLSARLLNVSDFR